MKVYFDYAEWWPVSVIDEQTFYEDEPFVEITEEEWLKVRFYEEMDNERAKYHDYLRSKYGVEVK